MTDQQALFEKLDNLTNALKLGRPALWTIRDIGAYCGLSETTVRTTMICRSTFPDAVKVTDDAKGRRWVPDEVVSWVLRNREILPKGRRKTA